MKKRRKKKQCDLIKTTMGVVVASAAIGAIKKI